MTRRRWSLAPPLLALALVSRAGAAAPAPSPAPPELAFASWLVAEGEPYLAISELLRLVHAGEGQAAAAARLFIARIAVASGELVTAAQAYSAYLAAWPAGRRPEILFEHVAVQLRLGQFPAAARTLGELQLRVPEQPTPLAGRLALSFAELALRADRYDVAVVALERATALPPTGATGSLRASGARALAVVEEGIPHRSPLAAGLLSALLPGAGQLYAHHRFDALVAFLGTGTAMFLTADAYQGDRAWTRQRPSCYLTAALAAAAYTWNILAAADTARHYNVTEEARWRRRVIEEVQPPAPPLAPGD